MVILKKMEDTMFINKRYLISTFMFLALIFTTNVAYSKPIVVVSIASLQALVQGLAGDKVEIIQIIPVNMSPHAYALKPTELSKIQQADAIFWVGPQMEYFLSKLFEKPEIRAKANALIDTEGLRLWTLRQDQERDMLMNADKMNVDPHIWLDPINAQKMLEAITTVLVSIDPQNKAFYFEALEKRNKELETLDKKLSQQLKPIRNKPYLVFHDGYQYFEKHYGLNSAGTVLLNPEIPLSGKQLKEIHEKIQQLKISCPTGI